MAISDWDSTASNNTNIDGVNIAENCPPGGINNAIRSIMAAVRGAISNFWLTVLTASTASAARAAMGVPEATPAATALGGVTPAADRLPYFNGASTAAITVLTGFARSLLDDGNSAAARATLEALGGTVTGNASSGTFAINKGASTIFRITWRDVTANPNGNTSVTYHSAFASWSRAWCTGGAKITDASSNDPFAHTPTLSGCQIFSARGESIPCTVFAVGV